MTDQEINVAIHKARGLPIMTDGWVPTYNDPDNRGMAPEAEPLPIPDYCRDLNAMHEAEQALANMNILDRVDLRPDYTNMLWFISAKDGGYPLMATALQRAEAFLRTIGKWRE